jgi:cytochrome c oxidase subunit 1
LVHGNPFWDWRIIFLANIIYSAGKGKLADTDDPFGVGGKYYYPKQAKNPSH